MTCAKPIANCGLTLRELQRLHILRKYGLHLLRENAAMWAESNLFVANFGYVRDRGRPPFATSR
jgi:hypothetical protein